MNSIPYYDITKPAKYDDLSDLLIVTGYVTWHIRLCHKDCVGCKMMYGNKDKPFDLYITSKHLDYFPLLNRDFRSV